MKIKFRKVRLSQANKDRLDTINAIIEEYQDQDLVLTLRQLYYQLVSRGVIPNKQSEYSKLSTLLKEGRMGGVVDWDAIEDRLRRPSKPSSWETPEDILKVCINQYELPRMGNQDTYVEVWVEKDALSGVLSRVTEQYHIPILVNRGYSSASAMYDSYNRFQTAVDRGQNVVVLYLGDFDPSGMDMIRDIKDRTLEFVKGAYEDENQEDGQDFADEYPFEIVPIALTREQIRRYNPPPNPAKRTDPRAKEFISKHGATSWEVDALRPEVLNQLLEDAIHTYIDIDRYNEIVEREEADRDRLRGLMDHL